MQFDQTADDLVTVKKNPIILHPFPFIDVYALSFYRSQNVGAKMTKNGLITAISHSLSFPNSLCILYMSSLADVHKKYLQNLEDGFLPFISLLVYFALLRTK